MKQRMLSQASSVRHFGKKRVLGALGVVTVLAASAGCSAADAEVGEQEGAATVGVPEDIVFGEMMLGGGGVELTFKPKGVETPIKRAGVGSDPVDFGAEFGAPLNKMPSQNYGWFTNTKWKCQDAEKFAYGSPKSPDPEQLCYLEINPTGQVFPTGSFGLSLTIIGLDASGEGLKEWQGSADGPRPAPVNGGAARPVADGFPQKVNETMDSDAVGAAMLAAHANFKRPMQERYDCVHNALTASWLDIRVHYYCQLPRETIRDCYSKQLVGFLQSKDEKVRLAAPGLAYDVCLAKAPNADAKWLHENQGDVFRYVMFTQQGTNDFDLTSENAAVSHFYSAVGETRPRRVIDTYPAWLPNQPRYEAIRKLQAGAQATGR